MGIDIDVVRMLEYVVNVVILVFILNKLLYKPVSKYLKARQDKINTALDSAAQKQQEADELHKQYDALVSQSRAESADALRKANEQASHQADQIISEAREQARQIDRTLAGFIRGQLSVCVILGTYYSLGLYLVGLDLGLLVGFIAGLISFIPYVGSIVGFLLSIGIAFAQFDSLMPILQVVLVFVTGQFLEGNFLTPKLVGENVGLHPVWVMFALLAGGVLLGFLGLMIAVPLAAVIGVLLRHAIENYKKSTLYLDS